MTHESKEPRKRITIDAGKMGGLPCIRGLRVPVAAVVGLVAEGLTASEVVDLYPDLDETDVAEALWFAAREGAVAGVDD